MSKRSSAFSRYAVACVALSVAPSFVSAAPKPAKTVIAEAPSQELPVRTLALSNRSGRSLRVGDTISYRVEGGDPEAEARWEIDPKLGGLQKGVLFRKGRLITPLAAGTLQLPALVLIDDEGRPVARTEPLELAIESNLASGEAGGGAPAEPPKPEPAIGPIGMAMPLWIQSAIGTAILAVVLVAAFFFLRAMKRRAARALRTILPKKPYDVAAIERLDALLKEGWLEKREYKPFYFGVSETLKFYLGERFDFDARESTTSELFAFLRERAGKPGLGDGMVTRIERLFEGLDRVKFADEVPTDGEARTVHREAREIVMSTRKPEPIAPEAKG